MFWSNEEMSFNFGKPYVRQVCLIFRQQYKISISKNKKHYTMKAIGFRQSLPIADEESFVEVENVGAKTKRVKRNTQSLHHSYVMLL